MAAGKPSTCPGADGTAPFSNLIKTAIAFCVIEETEPSTPGVLAGDDQKLTVCTRRA